MKVSILTTNGGPHSPEKWAIATASNIIEIAASAAGVQEMEGRKLENTIIDILEKHHTSVQLKERDKLVTHGSDALVHEFNVNEHVEIEDVVKEIVAAGKQSKWSQHFDKPEVLSYIRQVIGTDFATNMQIERFYHCDRNPHDQKAIDYKARYHG